MLSPKTIRKLKKTLPFVIIWMIASLLYLIIERGLLGASGVYPSTGNVYDFESSFIGGLIGGTIMGFIFGLLEVSIFNKIFNRSPFWIRILLKTFLYLVFIIIFLIVITLSTNSARLDLPLFHTEVIDSVYQFAINFAFLSVVIYIGFFILGALFISEMIDNLGMQAIANFFIGKYQKPKIEERIFMFLDMKASTTIAEKLGHVVYYKLLNAYYEDMTDAIIETEGEIYQYVGDEIVVSWSLKKGFKKSNCLRCFFLIKDIIQRKSNKYLESFDLVPEFKAGLHLGKVTTGEIGVIKKDILFTGDVLNTTARIQTMCNEQRVDILISEELNSELTDIEEFRAVEIGKFELRGRNRKIKLFAVEVSW